MSYKVVLQGKQELVITDEQADKLREVWKTKSQDTVFIGKDAIATSSIKGIFEIAKHDTTKQDAQWQQSNADWHNLCSGMATLTPEEKTEKELKVRIGSGYKLANGHVLDKYSDTYIKLWNELMDFFTANPRAPRCPMKIWYPIIRDELSGKPFLTKWFEYVSRNDTEVMKWCLFNGAKITFDYQKKFST